MFRARPNTHQIVFLNPSYCICAHYYKIDTEKLSKYKYIHLFLIVY